MGAAVVGATATGAQVLAAVQAQAGTPVQAAVAQNFKTASAGGLQPQFPATAVATEAKPASILLPQLASGAMHLQDTATGAAVDAVLSAALPVPAQTVGGYVVYPAALGVTASVLHRALPSGNEDFVYMTSRPATPEVDYTVSLGSGIAGLRLVGGVLEFLDSSGAPRLHVSPPLIVGADGIATDGALALGGCAADADPSPPWGRPVTAPGATTCTVKVTWPDAAVTYPAVLDPRWTTTGSMATVRFEHTLTLLSTGRALVAGGRSSTSSTTGLTSAELYDQTTGTWSPTGSMAHGRRLHTATQLATSSNPTTSGKILVAGGISGSSSLSSAELYSPSAGTWTAAGTMDAVRHGHTATLLPDGRVLAAGGLNGTTTLATASLYNPASGSGSWGPTTGPIPPAGLKNHTATLIQTNNNQLNNHVLLVGGNDGTSTLSAVYLFDPVQNAFSTLASISAPREQHMAMTLQNTNGKILVAGGKNGSGVLSSAIVFDPSFSNGSWSSAGTMSTARVGATMTLLPNTIVANGQVLVAGGSSNGTNILSSAELFSGTSTWTPTPSMPGALQGHQAVLLSGNMVLVAGGLSASTTVQNAAYLYDASFGMGCTSNSQCASGFCVSGICCDSACNGGSCGACNQAGHLGACTAWPSGTVCRASAGACDVAETCNGTSMACPADGFQPSTTVCRAAADVCDAAETCTGTSATCPSDSKKAAGTACTDDGNPCTADKCNGTDVACQHPAGNAGTVCRAANGTCDVAETCTGTSTSCPADGFQPSSTVCRPSTGQCDVAETCTGTSASCPADAVAANGTSCTDGNHCTQTDTCQAGVCTGTNPVTCTAQDQCHGVGTCNPADGTCSNPILANGTSCTDGNHCTQTDTCQAGVCTGSNPVTCTAQDQCHGVGTCNPADGTCSNPILANGTSCTDGNHCTQTDTCQAGVCTGTNPVTCTAQDQCHGVGTCNPADGTCSNPILANGTSCTDGNTCTTGDACQAGACVPGSNTCTALTIQQTIGDHRAFPSLSGVITSNVTGAVPGDALPVTFAVTNDSAQMRTDDSMSVTNNGTTPFVWGSYQVKMEYLSVDTQQWVPVAAVSFNADGSFVFLPPLAQMAYSDFAGLTIGPGQTANYDSSEYVTLPGDLIATMSDPAQVSQVRVEIHIDTGTAPGIVSDLDITDSFRAGATVYGYTGSLRVLGPIVPTLLPTTSADIPAGATVLLTGTVPAPPTPPRQSNENDAQYLARLVGGSYNVTDFFLGGSLYIPLLTPALSAQKTGPAQGNAGVILQYPVALQNLGAAAASAIQITDSVDGQDVGAQVSAPASVEAGATGTATLSAASPIGQAPGPYTDQASVSWQDRNGNVYGPVSSSYTTTLTAGHPEGYLTLVATGGSTEMLGSSVTLTATARDQSGTPVPNLPIQLAIAGSNGQTSSLVTGTDGTASFTYNGANLGTDTATVTATINGPTLTASASSVVWASPANGPPCTGRSTPLDVMMLVDDSPSMFSENTVAAAKTATDAFINTLDATQDQLAASIFMGDATLDQPLTRNFGSATSVINTQIQYYVDLCSGFCGGGTGYLSAFTVALTELQGPRHRSNATPVIVLVSDGGNTGPDYSAELAAIKAAGIRVITLGLGSNVNVAALRSIASSPNDYFYAPTASELGWTYANLVQDTCRTVPPLVSAGGNQGAYDVRLPGTLTLQGEAHGNGTRGDLGLTSTWTEISGPGPVTFADASSPVTDVLFTDPGTYVLQLETSDGFLVTASRVTVVVDPAQTLQGASLAVAVSSPGPLTVGSSEVVTATLLDASSQPMANFVVQVAVTGANAGATTLATNAAGVATFTYPGKSTGTDTIQVTAIGGTAQLAASPVSVTWTAPAPGSGSIVAQGWIGAPAQQTSVMGLVPITVAPGVTVTSGTISIWPSTQPDNSTVLTANAHGAPGATLATLDTTTLRNGSYVVDLNGTDDQGNQQDSAVLVTVVGDYKPGRVVVDVPEFTVPIAGLPITIGRHYDTLDKDRIGDFGNGWSLAVGHPDLQVDLGNNVTITMPGGRRVTFFFTLEPYVVGPIVLGFVAKPGYTPEPGVYGTLTSDGCSVLVFDPNNPHPICFANLLDPDQQQYNPTTYTYTDAYGTVYTMGADGSLKTIQDRNQNILTFAASGITSSVTGQTVAFTRDGQNRITKILTPTLGDFLNTQYEYDYGYDGSGNLATADRPPIDGSLTRYAYTYDSAHRLLTTTDPLGHAARTSTYDDAGRLATDKDALGNVTSYAYDVTGHTTTTTYPDTGALQQTFDDRGLLLAQTDQLGRTTTHEYDANRNETKRTNALGEATVYTYDSNGNQTSSKNALGETTTTAYNVLSEPLTTTNPVGNTTSISYDDSGLPVSFSDSMGPLATFTSSEHGLPTSVTDAAGNSVFMNYDGAGNLTSRTDRLGRQTTYTYDPLGRQLTKATPRGGVWQYGYDQRNELSGTDDPVNGILGNHIFRHDNNGNLVADYYQFYGHGTNYTYDALNHQTQALYADSTTSSATYDFRGNKLTETDEVGHVTSYTYDLAGQLTQTTYADGTFTLQSYDNVGRLASRTDERGNTTTYGYEGGCGCAERLTSVTDPLGRTTSMTYDGMGRKTSMTDAAGRTTFYVYDLRGHLIETDYPDGTATHDTYDALGRRTASTDQTSAATHYEYDAEGQLVSVTDPLEHVTHYAYDGDGNLTSVTDANGHVTSYAYDLMGEQTGRTLPLGMSESFSYDPVQEQLTHTDFRGKTTNFTYDPRKRLQSKVPDASLREPTVTYAYNSNGTRANMVDASGTTTYAYDNRNRLRTKATPEGTLTYTYDASGNVASIDSSNTNGTSVTYAWDAANQLVSVTDNRLGGMTTAAYTATGRPSRLAEANGVGVTYSYDSLDRVLSMAWKNGSSPVLARWDYTYSPRGQRLTATELTGREAAYGYDAASRLTSETVTGDPGGANGTGTLTYMVDAVGNRLSRTSTLPALGMQSFSYDSNDELTSDAYDPNGNTTDSGGHTFGYDFENRLISKDSAAVTIVYDGDGNRVAKTAGGVTTKYLVDELNPTGYVQVVEEVSSGSVQVRYGYGNTLTSQTRNASEAPATSFYGYDAHGNICFLTDATGTTTDTYVYDAWGAIVGRTGNTINSRLYGAEDLDPDLGLINLRSRQYNPITGRFISIDPIAPNFSGAALGQAPFSSVLPAPYFGALLDLRNLTPVSDRQHLVTPMRQHKYLYGDGDPADLLDPSGRAALVEDAEFQVSSDAAVIRVTKTLGEVVLCEDKLENDLFECIANTSGPYGEPIPGLNPTLLTLCVSKAVAKFAICEAIARSLN